MLAMAGHLAGRVEGKPKRATCPGRVDRAFALALGRAPTPEERSSLAEHASRFGLAHACRVIFNLNEFVFVD